MSRRVGDRLTPWVEAALDDCAGDDDVQWDGEMVLMDDKGAVAWMLHMFMPTAVLGTVFHFFIPLAPPSVIGEEAVTAIVKRTVEQMRSSRTEQLRMSGPPPNGAPDGLGETRPWQPGQRG